MTDWLFNWKSIVGIVAWLVAAAVLGIVLREGTIGNVASIVGLAVSILGFVVTIWTVLDARQQVRAAGEQAEKAIAQASEETRRAVRAIAAQLRAADCSGLRGGMEDLRQSAQDGKWPRATYRCQECRMVAIRLAHDKQLTADETSGLRAAADDLLLILRFIENNRLDGTEGRLQKNQLERLDNAIGLLAQIQARLHHQFFPAAEGLSVSQ